MSFKSLLSGYEEYNEVNVEANRKKFVNCGQHKHISKYEFGVLFKLLLLTSQPERYKTGDKEQGCDYQHRSPNIPDEHV